MSEPERLRGGDRAGGHVPSPGGLELVCAWCGRVCRDGVWRAATAVAHEAATHGICPDCAQLV